MAGGDKQRDYVSKYDVSSPTCSTESIMLTATIDAHERRDVETLDFPNEFLQTDVKELIVVRLRGNLPEMMVTTDPSSYAKYAMRMKKGQNLLYLHLNNALYGIMQEAVLFYNKLAADLISYGFTLNPSDPCVANKMVAGQQLMASWNVNDMKLSHSDPKVVSEAIEWLGSRYDTLGDTKMSVTHGTVHDFLGMQLDYSVDSKVNISMFDYTTEIIDVFPDLRKYKKANTPAPLVLFQVRPDTKSLSEHDAKLFHQFVAKLLYLTKKLDLISLHKLHS